MSRPRDIISHLFGAGPVRVPTDSVHSLVAVSLLSGAVCGASVESVSEGGGVATLRVGRSMWCSLPHCMSASPLVNQSDRCHVLRRMDDLCHRLQLNATRAL